MNNHRASSSAADLFITGGTGFVGHYVLAQLLRQGRRCGVMLRAPLASSLARLTGLLSDLGITAPLSRSERTVLCALWVLFFGMTAYALRDRLPVGGGTVARERDDGVDRRHFRDSRVALIGWFLLGAGFFGPSTFFFVGVLLLPVINTLSRYTSMAGPVLMGAWCVLCGFWTARHAQRRQRTRAAARRAPTLAR